MPPLGFTSTRRSLRDLVRDPGTLVLMTVMGVIAFSGAFALLAQQSPAVYTENVWVPGESEPGEGPMLLDATVYRPTRLPAPAVLLAHDFGGSKNDVDLEARYLAGRGFLVLAYSARGFGESGGLVHLNAPDYEVRDASRMIDFLASREDVIRDGDNDPRVGVTGTSYGGALALLTAGYDRRVDALVPSMTWNDLRRSFVPQYASDPRALLESPASVKPMAEAGVYKRSWASAFFGSALTILPPESSALGLSPEQQTWNGIRDSPCASFDKGLCEMYFRVGAGYQPRSRDVARLWASSPASVAGKITAPTMLIQGQADSLFPLSEADATARAIGRNKVPVKVVWSAGGHDGPADESEWLSALRADWFDAYLRHGGPARLDFLVSMPSAKLSVSSQATERTRVRSAPGYPGVDPGQSVQMLRVGLRGSSRQILAPPGGLPAGLSVLPGVRDPGPSTEDFALGLGGKSETSNRVAQRVQSLGGLPTQTAVFDSAPLSKPAAIVGGGRVNITVASTSPEAVLFASLISIAPDGTPHRPQSLVTPVRVAGLSDTPTPVTITLPAVAWDVPAGYRLRLSLTTTDQGYQLPQEVARYTVSLAPGSALLLPSVATAEASPMTWGPWLRLAAGIGIGLLLWGLVVAKRRRSRRLELGSRAPGSAPLEVVGVRKRLRSGLQPVELASFQVGPRQLFAILGAHGSGKTTLLQIATGLLTPSVGYVRVFGYLMRPGAPVLSRVGALIIGTACPPHLSVGEHLTTFWKATGRPLADAHLDEVVAACGLQDQLSAPYFSLGPGVRQQVGLAQALLGLPELLLLDEPLRDLTPVQVNALDALLRWYVSTGRTVVFTTSHLSDVQRLATHVVLMRDGRSVFQGEVSELSSAISALDSGQAGAPAHPIFEQALISVDDTSARISELV